MLQDFSKKFAIVVQKDLPLWQVMNAVAHTAAYLGNKMDAGFDTGDYFVTQDGKHYPRNTQYAIIILAADKEQFKKFITDARSSKLPYLGFIREMIETTDDAEIERLLKTKNDDEVEYLAVGIFGDKEKVSSLTKQFKLWKG